MMGVLMTLGAVAIVACAYLAAIGFKGRVSTVGVDLGTSFSVVGISKDGKIQIVTDKFGHNIFPSIVSFQAGGHVQRLYDAIPYLSSDPKNTIYNSKRFIGRNVDADHGELKEYASTHPFDIEFIKSSDYSDVGFRLSSPGYANVSSLSIVHDQPLLSPEYVGTEILRGLMDLTADFIGHKQVNKAVVAVPAKFTPEQRVATAEAYKKAGLKVVRMIEEPTAAAIAYDLHKNSSVHHIIVYDFGGGTLDVSLLYVAKGSVQVYATDGDESLGGSDFDICAEKIVESKINYSRNAAVAAVANGSVADSTGITATISVTEGSEVPELLRFSCAPNDYTKLAEAVKKILSSSHSVEVQCVDVDGSDSMAISFIVSRDEFLSSCGELFERAMIPVNRLLTDLDMSPSDIDEVVLVGGTTRIPQVKQRLKMFFGPRTNINDRIDPDVTVAYGAASIID